MIGTLDIECQAKNPNLPLAPMTAFVNSPSSLRIRNVPKRIGDWCIRNVYVTCVYPDATTKSVQCVLVGGVYVGTIQGTSTSGTSKNGYTIFADGTDENGNNVTGYILGKGDINILEADGQLNPDAKLYYVHLLSSEGQTHSEGDLWQVSGTYYIWQNGQAWPIGDDSGMIGELSAKVDEKADLSSVHSDYIEDADGNRIDADGDFTYLDSNKWSVDCGLYGKYVLSPTMIEEWTYAEPEGTEGNKKLVLEWTDYMQGWQLSYYQWSDAMLGWNLLSQGHSYDSPQATSLEIEITGDFSEHCVCRKGAPSTDKLATEGYVNGIVGNINSVLDSINGEVI